MRRKIPNSEEDDLEEPWTMVKAFYRTGRLGSEVQAKGGLSSIVSPNIVRGSNVGVHDQMQFVDSSFRSSGQTE